MSEQTGTTRFLKHLSLATLLLGVTFSAAQAETPEKATFAGGCFWCMEEAFDDIEGVQATVSGYANGHVENPSYEQVSAGGTGHIEAIQVTYDPAKVSYKQLLENYWPNVDPVDDEGQFCDRGFSYTTAILYHNQKQEKLARASKEIVAEKYDVGGEIVTPVQELTSFYPAEDYHQDYYLKNPLQYKFYKWNCGREARLDEVWGDTRNLDLF